MSATAAAWRPATVSLTIVLIMAALVMTMTYVFPREDTAARADAIVVLGGLDSGPVLAEAEQLADEHFSRRIVISDAFGGDTRASALCRTPSEYDISCFDPAPGTTAGEAEDIARFATDNNWDSLIIVTADYHVSRARVIVEQCFDGRLSVIGASVPLTVDEWLYQYMYQTGGFLKLRIQPAC